MRVAKSAGDPPANVAITLDAADLAPGSYATNACVHSNDPDAPVVAVPVSFTVTLDEVIFVDGFDGP